MAILVNGTKPIGAKARVVNQLNELNQYFIKITMQDSSADSINQISFEFNDLNDLKDYNKPQAVACIMKAVLVFTKLIDLNNASTSLHEQLNKSIKGSLQLHTWTGLPQGFKKYFYLIQRLLKY